MRSIGKFAAELSAIMKLVLYPFAMIYGWITSFRNHLYDLKIWKSVEFDVNVISIGNLAVGGTGKSPMVEYVVNLLLNNGHLPATLSRGYKRKTKGFRLANQKDNASTLGDEPYQFWLKFKKQVPVAVGEERVMAIPEILFRHENCNVVVCDDAYQHRPLRPGLSVLLSTFERPFFNDQMLPAGRLRESRKGANRADVLVFTKCPKEIGEQKKEYARKAEKYLKPGAPVFFARTKYHHPIPVFDTSHIPGKRVLLVTGLASSTDIVGYVEDNFKLEAHLEYADHHHYSKDDVNAILEAFQGCMRADEHDLMVLTTEKDAVKLREMSQLSDLPLFYLPIEIELLYEGDKFERLVLESFKVENSEG